MSELVRRTVWRPAFDKRREGCGIHGVEVVFLLIGPAGVVQFVIFTHWHLPEAQRETNAQTLQMAKAGVLDDVWLECSYSPMAADVGYHSTIPRYPGQTSMGPCSWLEGKECYYDGSSLQAEEMLKILIEQGDDAVWDALESRYKDWLGGE